MDMPTWVCVRGIFARHLRHGRGQRGNGVYNRINLGVLRYVLGYRRKMRPRVTAKIEQHAADAKVIALTSCPVQANLAESGVTLRMI